MSSKLENDQLGIEMKVLKFLGIHPKYISDHMGAMSGEICLNPMHYTKRSQNHRFFYDQPVGLVYAIVLTHLINLKGSSDQSHFIFEIDVGKGRI